MGRKVITGLGAVTPLGISTKDLYKALLSGRLGLKEECRAYEQFGYGTLSGQISSENKMIIKEKYAEQKFAQATLYALYAIDDALNDANLNLEDRKSLRFAIILGNNEAESEEFDYYLDNGYFPNDNYASHSICDIVARVLEINAVRKYCIHNTCASSNITLEIAGYLLEHDCCDVCIVGGTDAFSRKVHAGFNSLNAISKNRCKPFGVYRDGINISEGAGILILENYHEGKNMYCEYIGGGSSNDAKYLAAPDMEGIILAYKSLFSKYAILPREINYIMSHGTGTITNDKVESKVISEIYGIDNVIEVCSIKNKVGHMMASCGAIGCIIVAMSFKYGIIPGNNDNYEIDYDLMKKLLISNKEDKTFKYFINHSFGFGGNNSIALFSRIEV